MDGVIALEQASSPGRVLASSNFAELMGLDPSHSFIPSSSIIALESGGSLDGVGRVYWLNPLSSLARPNIATFMRSRPRKVASTIIVADLFSDDAENNVSEERGSLAGSPVNAASVALPSVALSVRRSLESAPRSARIFPSAVGGDSTLRLST